MFRTYAELGGDELVYTAVMVGQTADPLHEPQQVRFHHHIITLISILLTVSYWTLLTFFTTNI